MWENALWIIYENQYVRWISKSAFVNGTHVPVIIFNEYECKTMK